MARSKKNFLWLIVSVVCMLTSLFFIGCGETDKYKDVKLTSSTQSISMYVGQTVDIEYSIENYFENMNNSLNFSIVDSASGSSSSSVTSEHISLKVVSSLDSKIKVSITGLSSGHSSVIATTKEGMKQCIIDVTVKKYSKSFEENNEKVDLLFIDPSVKSGSVIR